MSLETFKARWPLNVPGQFYVTEECLDCVLCQEMVPTVFARDSGWSYVFRQPTTDEERALCFEVVEGCPLSAVLSDGGDFDWQTILSMVDRSKLVK